MLSVYPKTKMTRPQMVQALAQICCEWSEANEGSLLEAKTSVGLMMADVLNALNLSAEEKALVLGESLYRELSQIQALQ